MTRIGTDVQHAELLKGRKLACSGEDIYSTAYQVHNELYCGVWSSPKWRDAGHEAVIEQDNCGTLCCGCEPVVIYEI
jgi:hypothetical protein